MPKRRKPDADQQDKGGRDTVPVKLDRELHRKIKMLALKDGKELYEFLDGLVRATVEERYRKLFRE